MVAGDAVDGALHGVDEESALEGGGGDASGEILFGRERALRRLVGDEFYCPEKADAADVADYISSCLVVAQGFEGLFEVCRGSAGAAGVGSFYEFLRLQMVQDSASGGERNGMCVVGEAVQECA